MFEVYLRRDDGSHEYRERPTSPWLTVIGAGVRASGARAPVAEDVAQVGAIGDAVAVEIAPRSAPTTQNRSEIHSIHLTIASDVGRAGRHSW